MHKLYLFNPDHDLALANFDPNFMASANVRQLATDLSLLPAWYSDREDTVWAPSAGNRTFMQRIGEHFPDLPSLYSVDKSDSFPSGIQPSPWGWNPAVAARFIRSGMPPDALPSQNRLLAIREYSHRKFAVGLLQKLVTNDSLCGTSVYLTEMNEIQSFVENHKACVLKAPLSGSGKGLNWCKGDFTFHINHWCRNILKQQGGVVAEPLYDKAVDFAMQFRADADGCVSFTGYSWFETNASGAYVGNVLASDAYIEASLAKYVPVDSLHAVRNAIINQLTGIFKGVYSGYFGVDMMISRFDAEPIYRIHPCVEINLRMSMGMVSRIIYDRYVHPGSVGKFRVDYFPSHEKLKEATDKHIPLQISNSRIIKGYQPLVPVTAQSRYHAWIEVEPPN